VKDIGTAVDYILKRRNVSRLNLLGWSWTTTLMATYAILDYQTDPPSMQSRMGREARRSFWSCGGLAPDGPIRLLIGIGNSGKAGQKGARLLGPSLGNSGIFGHA
jgi:hypothetical protein